MRYLASAPGGVMDYLFINLMDWGKNNGYRRFSLGMAPFSGLEARSLAPVWNKFGAFLFSHGENFYNFQGLRQYKDKFDPVWTPRYLAAPGGLALPLVLKDISALISGGVKRARAQSTDARRAGRLDSPERERQGREAPGCLLPPPPKEVV